ncbi:MAG TPA: DUF5060 domain-containing protein [Chloroflexota bacterium]|nr:DUF5060 domain-containing protein [Chloroflexota bacterium]
MTRVLLGGSLIALALVLLLFLVLPEGSRPRLGLVPPVLRPDSSPPAESPGGARLSGTPRQWDTVTLDFAGPAADEADNDPNPFLDYRLQVTFRGPGGQTYVVPGFFDGDGQGNGHGTIWRVRFTPDQAGRWSYTASFRAGPRVAVALEDEAGTPLAFDGVRGAFSVAGLDPQAAGFLKWGRLEYVGGHYLKFRDGPYWLKGGTDSPENLLGYAGFDGTPNARHTFAPHAADWRAGDAAFDPAGPDRGRGLIGALNYLASQQVNSIYFLTLNVGGDGQDTSPFAGSTDWRGHGTNDNLHYDISKLAQWEVAFSHAQRQGLFLHFVLGEAETPNKQELDHGELGVERMLYYRELIARFGHHLALQWNLSEEYDGGGGYDLGAERIKAFATYIQRLDPYDHPITVHNAEDPEVSWAPFVGDARFSVTSLQYYESTAENGAAVERWRRRTAAAGRPLVISLDELRTATTSNAEAQRKEMLWPTYLSGGQLEWYIGAEDQILEDFRQYEHLWRYTWYARKFMEEQLPFWEMEPQDERLGGRPASGGDRGQVFAKPGEIYAVYLPAFDPSATLDLGGSPGTFEQRWYNPRRGGFEGPSRIVPGGGLVGFGTPPGDAAEDWVVLLKRSAGPPP